MAQALAQPQATRGLEEAYADEIVAGRDFNLGILCYIPKRPSGNTEEGTPYYAPGNTRPLSIVNTDSRLIASAARLRRGTPLNDWVSQFQRCFLPLRDIDFEAMGVSLSVSPVSRAH